ncbi:MAG: sulfoxide reductase heme-binding subunit YedZ [Burkholderiales bacterium]|nr:sulfoxide reductase heme-binding subunit YedZ [Burkholderiales bacterium]
MALSTQPGAPLSAVPAPQRPAPRPPSRANRALLHPAAKPLLFATAMGPFAALVYGAFADALGPNPAEALIHRTGDWTLRLLCLTLAVTPLRQLSGWHALARLRRMLGLFTAFYGTLHFLSYAWLDKGFVLADIVRDVAKRPFILVGTAALLLMLPLAATSFNRAIKALGAARWQALHRLVYAVALLGLLHFFWMRAAKNHFSDWSVYAAVMALLLGWRLWRRLRPAAHPAPRPAAPVQVR